MEYTTIADSLGSWDVHVSPDPAQIGPTDIPVHVRETSDRLFFVYTGQAKSLLMNPQTFCQKAGLFDHNLVVFEDPFVAYYAKGVSDSVNTFEALLDWERGLRQRLSHVRRTFCLGTSMGAFAAILHGHALCAEVVWAFAPKTIIDNAPSAVESAQPTDLKAVLDNSNGVTRYELYYNDGFVADRESALRLGQCDGVVLKPQNARNPNVVKTLDTLGLMAGVCAVV